jgi:uncharacterized repeat protein (TIGR01451 family)
MDSTLRHDRATVPRLALTLVASLLAARQCQATAQCALGACPLPTACATPGACPCPLPTIDQTGEHIFAPQPPHYHKVPHPWHEQHRPAGVVIWPRRVIAPVGSEVVMLAGVCDKDSRLRADENVEWILAPGGVGHFVAVGRRNSLHVLNLLTEAPKKIDNTYMLGTTSSHYLLLTRGTPTTDDDITVQKGQAWATVSSPVEGTSYVSVYGPRVFGWDRHQQTAEIYWVDAQWQFPPPAVNPVGTRHVFTTIVSKYSNRAPVIGWRVRYEITGGPEAGFAPDGAKVAEVPTNELGQASVEIFQPVPAPGVNQISIQVIRPDDSATGAQRMVMGTGSTTKTWSSPDIALRKSGPAQASVGALATYRIEVTNPGDALVRDVVVTDQVPPGMTHVASNPPATVQGTRLEWRLGDVGGRQTRTIEFNVRVDQPGTFNNCASLSTAEGLTAQDCVSTTVTTSALDVRMSAPEQAVVGQNVTFQLSITNGGTAPATGLRIVARFDAGLQHEVSPSPLERDLGDLAPGQTATPAITLRVAQPGRWCATVEVVSSAGSLGSAQACVTATQPPAGQQPAIHVEKSGPPAALRVGEIAEFNIFITNTGPVAVNDLRVADHYDVALDPVRATDGYAFVGDDLVWRIDTLPPGRRVRLQIHCRCQQPIARACNRITVTTREGARADGEACLEIQPAAAEQPTPQPAQPQQPPGAATNLTITISERQDPVAAGREVDYEVRVVNPGPAADRQVVVTVNASPELAPVIPGTIGPARAEFSGQRVQFLPVDQIGPGVTLTYRLRMRAVRPGRGRVSVQVSSQGMAAAAAAEETTEIFAEQ